MSRELSDFLRRSGVRQRCRERRWSDARCISFVKALCGMQHVSDPRENAELRSCMRRERCGRGIVPEEEEERGGQPLSEMVRWRRSRLKWFLLNSPERTTLTEEEVETSVRLALSVWSCYSRLAFPRARWLNETDLVVVFSRGAHGFVDLNVKRVVRSSDGAPFDGAGGVLAHAYFPVAQSAMSGNLHMDGDELWAANMAPGALNLFAVLVHEAGHALGLPHTDRADSVMQPFYAARREADTDLGAWDVLEVRRRYGARLCTDKPWQRYFNAKFPAKLRSESRHSAASSSQGSLCAKQERLAEQEVKSSAMVCELDSKINIFSRGNSTYLLTDGKLFRRSAAGGPEWLFRGHVTSLWRGVPRRPSAATFRPASDSLFLFKGRTVVEVKGFADIGERPAVRRATIRDRAFPPSPSAAFVKFDERRSSLVRLIKGDQVFVFDTWRMEITSRYPLADMFEVGDYKGRIPGAVDSAFHLRGGGSEHDDVLFLLTGSSCTKAFPEGSGKYSIASGSTPFATSFLGCPQK